MSPFEKTILRCLCLKSLDDGIAGLSGNTAHVVVVAAHFDVTLFAPDGAP